MWIKQATKNGRIWCDSGGVADLSYPKSKTRRGRVINNGHICPTITACGMEIYRIEKGCDLIMDGTVEKDGKVYAIRKLTPLECWRLMGFTDEDFHKAEAVNSNTQLYKQAGNSIVKGVLMAIFSQMIDQPKVGDAK